jgi:hypothetical protein
VFSNLDRIQIIKGWIDDAGERQKRVYDVAVLGGTRTVPVRSWRIRHEEATQILL